MKIKKRTINFLGKTLCGDNDLLPYKKGQELVDFFVEHLKVNDKYGPGFPSRWEYTVNKIREFNHSNHLKLIIEKSVEPHIFRDTNIKIIESIEKINEYLRDDGYELKKVGDFFKIHDLKGLLVEPKIVSNMNDDFIKEQLEKCYAKIEREDFSGAITNARTLVERIMNIIIKKDKGEEFKRKGYLIKLYKEVKEILNLTISNNSSQETKEILSGLISIINGIAGLSNNFSDRHDNDYITSKHYARLAVNSAITVVDFLLEIQEYQKSSIQKQ